MSKDQLKDFNKEELKYLSSINCNSNLKGYRCACWKNCVPNSSVGCIGMGMSDPNKCVEFNLETGDTKTVFLHRKR